MCDPPFEILSFVFVGSQNHSVCILLSKRCNCFGFRIELSESLFKPRSKLGRLVKKGHTETIEDILTTNCPIGDIQALEEFANGQIGGRALKIFPLVNERQKIVAVAGDTNGHIGKGVAVLKDRVQTFKLAIIKETLSFLNFGLGVTSCNNEIHPTGLREICGRHKSLQSFRSWVRRQWVIKRRESVWYISRWPVLLTAS